MSGTEAKVASAKAAGMSVADLARELEAAKAKLAKHEDRAKYYAKRKRVRDQLFVAKAKAAGLSVSEAEVEKAMQD